MRRLYQNDDQGYQPISTMSMHFIPNRGEEHFPNRILHMIMNEYLFFQVLNTKDILFCCSPFILSDQRQVQLMI